MTPQLSRKGKNNIQLPSSSNKDNPENNLSKGRMEGFERESSKLLEQVSELSHQMKVPPLGSKLSRKEELEKEIKNNTKRIIKDFLKDKKGLEKLSKEIQWLYNTPDDLIEMVFNAGKKEARLDERIRAEQDFLKMIDKLQKEQIFDNYQRVVIGKLKSTIKQEKKE